MHWIEEKYLGKPWSNGGHGPDQFDCWGLVCAVYKGEFDIDLDVVDVDAHAPMAVRHAMIEHEYRSKWDEVEVTALVEGDVILMSQAKHPHHVGVFVEGGVLHCVEGAGVVFQNMTSLKQMGWNITNCYRRKA